MPTFLIPMFAVVDAASKEEAEDCVSLVQSGQDVRRQQQPNLNIWLALYQDELLPTVDVTVSEAEQECEYHTLVDHVPGVTYATKGAE